MSADGVWDPAARVRCLACGHEDAPGPAFAGCPACGGVLEVAYAGGGRRLPVRPDAIVDLGQGRTPLVSIGGGTYLKNEAANPTWSHKDRAHGVNAAAALALGRRGLVCATTGNHGASASAFAAAAGLRSMVFCHPRAPRALLDMIRLYGGELAELDGATARSVERLVDGGWYPATSMDARLAGRATPYGAEGYKAIAWEIAEQLGGVPRTVVVPAASGDTLFGVAKGFAELAGPAPRIVAVQPAAADPLARSRAAGREVEVADPRSGALSIAEARAGRQALFALERWRCAVVSVGEEQIAGAVRELARRGLLLEPASAATLPALAAARAARLAPAEGPAVLLATSAGAKWLEHIAAPG